MLMSLSEILFVVYAVHILGIIGRSHACDISKMSNCDYESVDVTFPPYWFAMGLLPDT